MSTSTAIATAPHLAADPGSPAQFFAQHGYWVARGMFGGQQLAELHQDFDRIVTQITASGEPINARWTGAENDRLGQGVVLHTHNVHMYSAAWLAALQHPSLLDLASVFLGGPDIILHHSKLFSKPAGNGAPFPSHQDWDYFPMEKNLCIAAIIHISDADDAMGCLRLVPGSHHAGRISNSKGTGAISELQRRYPIDQATPIEATAGDVVFFHCLTVHGSLNNTSPRTRKTVLTQMYSGQDVPQRHDHPDCRLVLRGFNPHMTRRRADR